MRKSFLGAAQRGGSGSADAGGAPGSDGSSGKKKQSGDGDVIDADFKVKRG